VVASSQDVHFWKLVPEASRHDVDAVIESNVLFYLGERPETQPIIEYFIRVLRRGEEDSCDRWYFEPLHVLLRRLAQLSRGSRGFSAKSVTSRSRGSSVPRSRTDRSATVFLNTALAACALLYWGVRRPRWNAPSIYF